jgi:hypothetical protein
MFVQCPLKVESEPTLKALAAASHMLVMITGAQGCMPCTPKGACVVGEHAATNTPTLWVLL